ncbi:hypothetical protein CDAR_417531 [Caerostris darwini]|uniref:Uncharacterized protein n=1 Tax=Caerostris darwini TaxID=1538125 RepID=A0AAV4WFQ2_9ARAC|nr:hypothetical protein CDAR_417531 [Caerostris darwini]
MANKFARPLQSNKVEYRVKGKSSTGLISLSEVHHDTSAGFHLSEPPLHTAGVLPTSFGKSKPIICDAFPLKDQGDNAIEGSLEIPLSTLVPETGNSFKRETA